MSVLSKKLFNKPLAIIAVLALCFGLSACSTIKLAYKQADELMYWWLDGYVDFHSMQSPKVRQELGAIHTWHRSKELPKLLPMLSELAALAHKDISAAQSCKIYAEGRALFKEWSEQLLPQGAELALMLDAAQIENVRSKFAKSNAEFSKDFISSAREKAQERRVKMAQDRIESVYGRLDDPQMAVIRSNVSTSIFDPALVLKDRIRRQTELLALLNQWQSNKPSKEVALVQLRSYFERSQNSPDVAYRAYNERFTQQTCQHFAALHASTHAAQRAKAVQTLKSYENDLKSLISGS